MSDRSSSEQLVVLLLPASTPSTSWSLLRGNHGNTATGHLLDEATLKAGIRSGFDHRAMDAAESRAQRIVAAQIEPHGAGVRFVNEPTGDAFEHKWIAENLRGRDRAFGIGSPPARGTPDASGIARPSPPAARSMPALVAQQRMPCQPANVARARRAGAALHARALTQGARSPR